MKLTSKNVTEIFMDCLFKENENKSDPKLSEGITMNLGFHKERIKNNEKEIYDLLTQLPLEFQEEKGGGMSFLNACNDSKGNQWTREHEVMEQLFLLGQACDKVKCLLPREVWSALPGGMPYYMILKTD